MGPPRRGVFWDRWLSAYYADRVPVHVAGSPDRELAGPPLRGRAGGARAAPPDPPPPQRPPAKGHRARLDAAKAGHALAKLHHQLVAFPGGDGHPVVVPVRVAGATRAASSSAPRRGCSRKAVGARTAGARLPREG